jgi:hypothetical protein
VNFDRSFRNQQFYGFYQGSLRMGTRAGVNFGVRYESFGAPKNVGAQDAYLKLGTGATIEERLTTATLARDDSAQRSLYAPDRNNWAGRFGAYYDISGRGQTVVRGAYGIFFDRPFENLTSNIRSNNFQIGYVFSPPYPDPTLPPGTRVTNSSIPDLLWVDEGLRTPYVQSWFGGIQHQYARNLYIEVSAQGALGRKLISTDVVNRTAAMSSTDAGRLNPGIPTDIIFRSNQGSSSYSALTALTRYAGRRSQFQAAYTWSHAIDNQSDPLQGTFGDLQLSTSNVQPSQNIAQFTRQFDARTDRGSSDFDQRHNLVLYGIQEIGRTGVTGWRDVVLGRWQIAGIAAVRSGFPFNVISTSDLQPCPGDSGASSAYEIIRNRPGLVPGKSPFLPNRVPVPGGYLLMDASAFCDPGPSQVGNLGRNVLTGPGFWNADLSIAKSFRAPRLREGAIVQVRADFFNVFNHANLGTPSGVASTPNCGTSTLPFVPCPLATPSFGEAFLGRQGVQPSFPSATPLDQLARQVQLQLKIIF